MFLTGVMTIDFLCDIKIYYYILRINLYGIEGIFFVNIIILYGKIMDHDLKFNLAQLSMGAI